MKILAFITFLSVTQIMLCQNSETMQLPYKQIPGYPEDFTSGNVISRFIDGLGYRYYWATEGLTKEDLNYTPSTDGRTMLQTLQHIYDLSKGILNAPQNLPNIRNENQPELNFGELRKQTLLNLKKASALLSGKSAEDVSTYKVIFQSGDNKREFPYWNMINGQISDAIYHVGQIVSFRRSSGNPMNPKVSVFIGKTGR
ncbi:DinB family protein [Aquimarina gracilis]|uniref:DinB family protein n=1 Tax=Aquimarina gracilis TaxID=874422 RepID=A0ABU5ZSC0_9FLAO|nr:DinB family protein [Aquimarina gracilis]MEB3344937.1 DinB family protein [Aquimarina gracilis]